MQILNVRKNGRFLRRPPLTRNGRGIIGRENFEGEYSRCLRIFAQEIENMGASSPSGFRFGSVDKLVVQWFRVGAKSFVDCLPLR